MNDIQQISQRDKENLANPEVTTVSQQASENVSKTNKSISRKLYCSVDYVILSPDVHTARELSKNLRDNHAFRILAINPKKSGWISIINKKLTDFSEKNNFIKIVEIVAGKYSSDLIYDNNFNEELHLV